MHKKTLQFLKIFFTYNDCNLIVSLYETVVLKVSTCNFVIHLSRHLSNNQLNDECHMFKQEADPPPKKLIQNLKKYIKKNAKHNQSNKKGQV